MTTKTLTYALVGKDQLSPVLRKAGDNAVSVSSSMKNALGKAALAFGAVGLAAAGAAVKLSVDFQSSMQKISGLVGVSQKQVDQWSHQILGLSTTLPQSPKELANAMYFITSAGIKASDAMGVLTASAKASAAGLGDTATVADAVTSAVNAYGIKNLSAASATDIMVNAVKVGKIEADQLAGTMGRVIPVASQMGVSFDQAAAAMASMSTIGMDADEAATSLQAILSGLLKPSQQGAKALQSVGLSFSGLRAEIKEKGLYAALMTVKTAFNGNDAALAQVIPNVRALRGFLSLTGNQAGATKQIFNDLAKSTGATNTAFKVASQTTEFKMKVALSSLQASAINLGSVMLPIVSGIASAFTKLLAPIAQNKAAFASLAIGVIAFATTAKAAMMAFSVSAKAALVTSVVGIAILALSVAITELLLHWSQVWGALKKVTLAVTGAIVNAAKSVWNWLKQNWPYLLGILTGPIGMAAVAIIKNWSKITSAAKAAFNAVVSFFRSVPSRITGAIGNIGSLLYRKGKDVVQGFFNGLLYVWNKVTGWIKGLAGWIKAHKGPLSLDMKLLEPAGRALMHGLKVGLLGGFEPIKDIVSGAAGTIRNGFSGLFGTIGGALGIKVEGPSSSAMAYAKAMLKSSYNWGADQWPALYNLWNGESGWRWNAKNPSSGAYGIPQALPASKMASFGSDYLTNPATQINWGLNYIANRYGSPSAAFSAWLSRSPHWYDSGGVLKPGLTLAMNGTGHDEYVVNPGKTGSGGDTYITEIRVSPSIANPQETGRAVVSAILAFERGAGTSWRRVHK